MARDRILTHKFQMMMSDLEVKQIDDWMFSQRLKSRADAIRRLCQVGIETERLTDELKSSTVNSTKQFAAHARQIAAMPDEHRDSVPHESMEMLMRSLIENTLIARELEMVRNIVRDGRDPFSLSQDIAHIHDIYASMRKTLRKSYDDYKQLLISVEKLLKAITENDAKTLGEFAKFIAAHDPKADKS